MDERQWVKVVPEADLGQVDVQAVMTGVNLARAVANGLFGVALWRFGRRSWSEGERVWAVIGYSGSVLSWVDALARFGLVGLQAYLGPPGATVPPAPPPPEYIV